MSNLEQLWHTHRNTRTICCMKPTWNTGLYSSKWPKCPGHSVILPEQVWQRELRSGGPWRGSSRPPSLGLPASVVSAYFMPPSPVTDMLFCSFIFFFVFLFSIRRKKTLNIKIKLSRQTYNLLGTEYAELYSLDVTIGRRRIGYARVYERHICSLSLSLSD